MNNIPFLINTSIIMFMAYLTVYHFIYYLINRNDRAYLGFSFLIGSLTIYVFLSIVKGDIKTTELNNTFIILSGLAIAYSLVIYFNNALKYTWKRYYLIILAISTFTGAISIFIINIEYDLYLNFFFQDCINSTGVVDNINYYVI